MLASETDDQAAPLGPGTSGGHLIVDDDESMGPGAAPQQHLIVDDDVMGPGAPAAEGAFAAGQWRLCSVEV